MSLTTSLSATRGGGRLGIPLPVIKSRLLYYYRKRGMLLYHLPKKEREYVVWVLHNQYSLSLQRIADMLAVSRRQIIRDFDNAGFMKKRNKTYAQRIDDIDAYILYIGKYLPSYSEH